MVDWASKMQLGKQNAVDITVEIRDYGRDCRRVREIAGEPGRIWDTGEHFLNWTN
jgi:predicted metal-dependent phosphotriesterase family hydrolase